MTIGSQLRDFYIERLEAKDVKNPIIELSEVDMHNELVAAMITSAAASEDGTFVESNFTVRVRNGEPTTFWGLHVFARTLKGETTKSKLRDAVAQEKLEKKFSPWVAALNTKKFSANPKLNEDKVPWEILEDNKPAIVQETERKLVPA